ncbi:MAG: SGNH/GDSL hydrolase family protein [Verrucomicrobiota bacterium]
MRNFSLVGILACLTASVFAEDASLSSAILQPSDGDTVVFVGDSITHQALYTQYLENFFYTRYPEREITFHNAGVAGDKATDVLARFDQDIAEVDPDYVTILLGMNDGQYEPFSAETLQTYREGIRQLVEKVRDAGGVPIALSPTMFDHHQQRLRKDDETYRFREKTFDPAYNNLLAYFSAWLREESSLQQMSFVDLWSPLNELTFAKRRHDPDFTLIEDAIHPGAAGHFLLAYTILTASEQERPFVSDIRISRTAEEWIAKTEGQLTELNVSDSKDNVSFQFLARSIPWRVPEKMSSKPLRWGPSAPATLGYELTGAGKTLNRETLRIEGLAPGIYELQIDGTKIDSFTDRQLDSGVELQDYHHSPQNEQALQVALLNRDRTDDVVRPMREKWSRIKGARKRGNLQELAGITTVIDQALPFRETAREIEVDARALATPVVRRYQLSRISSAD